MVYVPEVEDEAEAEAEALTAPPAVLVSLWSTTVSPLTEALAEALVRIS